MERYVPPILCLVVVVLLGVLLPKDEPPALDLEASRTVQRVVGPGVGRALEITSAVLAPPWAGLATVGLALLVGLLKGARSGAYVLACLASTQLLVEFTKAVTKRRRPDPTLVVGGSLESTHAFPSGHVAFTAAAGGALTLALARGRNDSKERGLFLAAVLTIWVALSRIYLGRHWLTDTIAGAVLAVGVTALCTLWLPPRGPPRGAPPDAPPPPAPGVRPLRRA
jgi:undecaprenyl-diphosphatase